MNAPSGRKTESTPTRTVTSKGLSPHKLHSNMANMLVEQRANEDKESFVRTVLTARQKCDSFNTQIRQNEQYALTARDSSKGIINAGIEERKEHSE